MSNKGKPVDIMQLIEDLRRMGPVKPQYRNQDRKTQIIDDKIRTKCACDKVVDVISLPRMHSGVVPYIDNVCRGCESHRKGLATIICVQCHRVAMRMPPMTDKWGFKIEAGKTYHLQFCPICEPSVLNASAKYGAEVAATPIVEMLLWHRKMGVKC